MRNALKLAALALVVVSGACTPMDDAMAAIFGRSMRDQATFDPYEDPLLPAEGSVSFSSGNFPVAPGRINTGQPETNDYLVPDFTQAQTANPGHPVWGEFENPIAGDESSLERGELMYNRYCAVCHGEAGVGAEAYILDKWPALVAYNLAGGTVQNYPDTYIYGMIRRGRGLMPQYGHQITHFDRWSIVNYVRTLQAEYNAQAEQQDGED